MSSHSSQVLNFEEVGITPDPGDNTAIATRRLEMGTRIAKGASVFSIEHTVLEGHRFAVAPIRAGESLLSWGMPFGEAISDMPPGSYACNEKVLQVLRERHVDFELPEKASFRDRELCPYKLEEGSFGIGEQVPPHEIPRSFVGYRRGASRGVGTRNYIVLLGVTSETSGYVKSLERRLEGLADRYANVDGIVAVAHTEGGTQRQPNNLEFLLRTLCGFMVHPNVGAVLAVDYATGAVTNQILRYYARENGYPLEDVSHEFLSLKGSFREDLEKGANVVRGWLDEVNGAWRTEEDLSNLKIGLQCGGSDAFSGISANPLVGWVAREIVRYGGAANLAETDELIGAESYILKNVRAPEVARSFLENMERFKERVGWHGHTAEGNPSGGNNYRGLYNISIKSLGAAMKKDPQIRLDHVIGYAERMAEPGFYFMDSPGNDLESVAGQVASGAALIFFTTGNGSITNFPFVPTIKVVSTTGRYELLSNEMDVNAGAYLDGTPMDELGEATLDLTIRAASGEKTAGERAGHSQVSIWRDWQQTGADNLDCLKDAPVPDGKPLPLKGGFEPAGISFEAIKTPEGAAADQVALIMPTSLCSGQIAMRIASSLDERGLGENKVTRFVSLPHTEGCGVSSGSSEDIYVRTVLGYLKHPSVRVALLLEHGCEKTHNDYFKNRLAERGMDPEDFGWASIQLDGGIEAVTQRVEDWFARKLEDSSELSYKPAGPEALRIGLHASGFLSDDAAGTLARLTGTLVSAGATVVVPENASLLSSRMYVERVFESRSVTSTLAYGQSFEEPGLHVMETPTDHWIETATGLGATGVEVMLAHVAGHPLQAHRMVPLIQVSSDEETLSDFGEDLDVTLEGDPSGWNEQMLQAILAVGSRSYTPRLYAQGDTAFQLTRGLLGVSM